VQCIVSDWQGWSECSEYCGDGVQNNQRTILQEPAYGGEACPYLTTERNCKIKECPLDCQSEWGTWSDCSYSCGGGFQTRTPVIVVEAAYEGKACPQAEERECNTDYCAVDCEYTRWGAWTECSEYCGQGVKYKERSVTVSPKYGGKRCPNLKKQKNCMDRYCPVDCDYEWGPWSECSKSCGGGFTQRVPKVTTAHAYGGSACPQTEQGSCGTDYCPVDCYLSDWSDWSDCNEKCGAGVQFRERGEQQAPGYGGKACAHRYEEKDCSYGPCAVDCAHEWGAWGECSRTCGGGQKSRAAVVLVAAAHGADRRAKSCPGDEYATCNSEYCPVDCEYSDWQGWSACSEYCGDGVQYNKRTVTQDAGYGGKVCPHMKKERDCFLRYCPVDCKYTHGAWSACSVECGGGYQTRRPAVTTQVAYGGEECPGEEQKACNEKPCALDCVVSDWGGWSDCNEPCGPGVQYNRRGIAQKPAYGGQACPPLAAERACKVKECAVDCDFDWGPWSACSRSCGGGQARRQPRIYQAHAHGGEVCPPDQFAVCETGNCPVDCAVAQWGDWSDCSEPCGEGVQYRSRMVAQAADFGGRACPPSAEEKNCFVNYCAVDCKFEWGAWGPCDTECGAGTTTREASVAAMHAYGGAECPGREQMACNEKACALDCEVSEWGGWSDCSEYCGEGVQVRVLTCRWVESLVGSSRVESSRVSSRVESSL
jgi:hypothetical protein